MAPNLKHLKSYLDLPTYVTWLEISFRGPHSKNSGIMEFKLSSVRELIIESPSQTCIRIYPPHTLDGQKLDRCADGCLLDEVYTWGWLQSLDRIWLDLETGVRRGFDSPASHLSQRFLSQFGYFSNTFYSVERIRWGKFFLRSSHDWLLTIRFSDPLSAPEEELADIYM